MFRRFLPKTTCFFDYFEKHTELTQSAITEFLSMIQEGANSEAHRNRIHEIENKADTVAHECLQALQQTFITPFDRSQIHKLVRTLDDIMDALDEAACRCQLYGITEYRPETEQFTKLLAESVEAIHKALVGLRNLKNTDHISEECIRIHRLENRSDTILRSALSELFNGKHDTLYLIKWKEIFEFLEQAIDRCEDVSDMIQGIVIEAS